MPSVLQSWVEEIPLRAQGTLLASVRNCDFAPKNPKTINERYGCSTGDDTPERKLTAFLRYCVLRPADPREVDVPGAWFQSKPPEEWRPSQMTHYPTHWIMHLMHAYEVVAYCHPSPSISAQAFNVYCRFVTAFHLHIETKEQMLTRLLEDRFVAGTVVS